MDMGMLRSKISVMERPPNMVCKEDMARRSKPP